MWPRLLPAPIRWKIPNDYAAVRQMQNSATPLTKEDYAHRPCHP